MASPPASAREPVAAGWSIVHLGSAGDATFSLLEVPKDAFPTDLVHGPTAGPALRLITCAGAFDRDARHYLSNAVVSAVPARAAGISRSPSHPA